MEPRGVKVLQQKTTGGQIRMTIIMAIQQSSQGMHDGSFSTTYSSYVPPAHHQVLLRHQDFDCHFRFQSQQRKNTADKE